MKKISILTIIMILTMVPVAFANLTDGLVAYWQFEDGSGSGVVGDSTVNAHQGTFSGDMDPNTDWVTGQVGSYALDFDGDGDYITIPDSTDFDFGSGDFAIAGWAYVDSLPSLNTYKAMVAVHPDPGSPSSVLIGLNSDGTLGVSVVWTSGSGGWALSGWAGRPDRTSSTVPVGSWFHYALTKGDDVWNMYINGVEGYEKTMAYTLWDGNIGVRIGANDYAPSNYDYFPGKLDDIAIWKGRSLSGDEFGGGEVGMLYDLGMTGNGLYGAAVPELPPAAMQMILLAVGFGAKRSKRRGKGSLLKSQ